MKITELPVLIKRQIETVPFPVIYERARSTLRECERIDECKDMADQAQAIAMYAKQAKNKELEFTARRIRLRAWERIGEFLLQVKPGKPHESPSLGKGGGSGRAKNPHSISGVARAAGLDPRSAHHAMRIAAAPRDIVDAAIDGPTPANAPTALAKSLPRRQLPVANRGDAYMRTFGKYGWVDRFLHNMKRSDAAELATQFDASESARARRSMIEIMEWLDEFERHLPKERKGA